MNRTIFMPILTVGCQLLACGDPNIGTPPVPDELHFPSGLVVDSRGSADTPTRWLFAVNSNSDLKFNGSSVLAIDLEAFFAAWQEDPITGAVKNNVPDVGTEITSEMPCRRNLDAPQVIECTEGPFIASDATVYIGSFATVLRAWDRDPNDDRLRLFSPIRSNPSVAYMEIRGGLDGSPLTMECGQDAERSCSTDWRMRYWLENDENQTMAQEPFNMLISPDPAFPFAYVAHSPSFIAVDSPNPRYPELTLIDLTGVQGGDGRPAIVDQQALLSSELGGYYGLAHRPCSAENAPNLANSETGTCTRPLVYAGHRSSNTGQGAFVSFFSVDTLKPESGPQKCVSLADLGQSGGVLCEPRIVANRSISLGGYPLVDTSRVLGDMEFSLDGNQLYIVQTNPGALLIVDTSIDEQGEIRNNTVDIIEICAEPTSMLLFGEFSQYAAISCYKPATVFVVDLQSFQVVHHILVGTGPNQMAYDPRRDYIYVANTLDATISVVDVSTARVTGFSEIARIGLQEPFSQ